MDTRLLLLSLALVGSIACDRGSTDDPTDTDTDAGDDVVDEGSDTDTDGSTDDDGTESDSDTETEESGTDPEPQGRDSWCGALEDPSMASASPVGVDAGIAEVLAQVPTTGGERVEISSFVNGAIVTATGYPATRSFWVGDDDGGILLYLSEEVAEPSVGDAVSFTATEVTNYYGEREVTAISDFEIVSSGNTFYVPTLFDTELSYDSDVGRVGYLYGELTGDADAELCWGEGYSCMVLEHGSQEIMLRVKTDILTVGDWVEYCGPITGNNSEPTINATDWDWFETY